MKLNDRFRSWRLRRRIIKGKINWGRQPGKRGRGGNVSARMRGKTTIAAKITRADGTVEDLGVIARW